MASTDIIYVVGHRNPDTDSIAAAMGYAWVLAERDKWLCRAVRVGELNAQTAFALQRFGLDAPEFLTDAWVRVGQLAGRIGPLRPAQPLLDAARAVAAVRRAIPIVASDGHPLGIITAADLFAALNDVLAGPIMAHLEERLASPCESATDRGVPIFRADERVRDVRPAVLRGLHDEFLVVDDDGRYLGLVTKADVLAPRQVRLVLVDHNEPAQAVLGLEEANLLAVLDHHRLGNPPTTAPIRFKVDPVGSCSTLVSEEATDAGLTPPPALCGVLLCGILSDTLILRSPTTTTRDRAAAARLARGAGLVPADAPHAECDAAIAELGNALLSSGAGFGARSAEQLVSADLKTYQQGTVQFAIAQVEVTGFAELEERLEEVRAGLEALREREGYALAVLFVTDVVRGTSRLVTVGPTRLLDELPYARRPDGTLDARGVVSRKKQLLPAMLAALAMQ